MGIADVFNQTLHQQLKAHAAWPPIANSFKLGTYGRINNGIFEALGDISEHNLAPQVATSAPPVRLDFASQGVVIVKVAAGATVSVIPAGAVDAKIHVTFSRKDSILLKAAVVRQDVISNVAQIAHALKSSFGWERGRLVVGKIWRAENALLVGSSAAGTELTLHGSTQALRAFDVGAVDAGLEVSSSNQLELQVAGESGVIGLGLFRLRLLRADPQFLDLEESRDFEWLGSGDLS